MAKKKEIKNLIVARACGHVSNRVRDIEDLPRDIIIIIIVHVRAGCHHMPSPSGRHALTRARRRELCSRGGSCPSAADRHYVTYRRDRARSRVSVRRVILRIVVVTTRAANAHVLPVASDVFRVLTINNLI